MCKKMRDELKMNLSSIYLQFKLHDKECRLQRQVKTQKTCNDLVEMTRNNENFRGVRKRFDVEKYFIKI